MAGPEAVVGEHGGMDAARELAQLRERDGELVAELVDGGGRLRVVAQPRAQQPQVERERDELLLGAVVQVALDLAAGVVGGLDDPPARVAQLLQPRAQVGLQALVVERQRGGRRGRVHQLRRRVQLGVVHDRRDAVALALDGGPRAARPGAGQRHGMAALVDEDLAVGQPVGDVQRAVAEPLGEHLAHGALAGHVGAQQRLREPAQQPPDAVLHRDRHDGGGQREQAQRDPDGGAERPRADEPVGGAAEAVGAEHEQRDGERDRRRGQRERGERDRQLQQQHRERAPERPAPGLLERLPPVAERAARRARDRRQVGVEQPVGLPPLALGELPSEPHHAGQEREPDPDQAEHGAEHETAADQHQVRDAVRDAEQRRTGRRGRRRAGAPTAGGRPVRGGERSLAAALDGHVAAAAERLHGVGRVVGHGQTTDALGPRVAVHVDAVAARRDDGAHVPGGRPELDAVRRAVGAGAARRPTPRSRSP